MANRPSITDQFDPEQIYQIIEEYLSVVGRRQYIGARYVPIFGRVGEDSIEWDNTAPYEPLTIVLYQGNSYTSRQYVPTGIEITNEEFWACTGNYNAQIEAYRREVLELATQVDGFSDSLNLTNSLLWFSPEDYGAKGDGITDDSEAIQSAIDAALDSDYPFVRFTRNYRISQKITIDGACCLFAPTVQEFKPTIFIDYSSGVTGGAFDVNASSLCVTNLCFRPTYELQWSTNCFDIEPPTADVDCFIRNCKFFYFRRAVAIHGRSMVVENSNFSNCAYGLWIEQKAGVSDSTRSYVVNGCRFHGYGKDSSDSYNGAGIYFNFTESFSQTFVQIINNYCDRSLGGTFIEGSRIGGYISNNHVCTNSGVILKLDGSNVAAYTQNSLNVCNNRFEFRESLTTPVPVAILRNSKYVMFTNNIINNCFGNIIECYQCDFIYLYENVISLMKATTNYNAILHLDFDSEVGPATTPRYEIKGNKTPTPDSGRMFNYLLEVVSDYVSTITNVQYIVINDNEVLYQNASNIPYSIYNTYTNRALYNISPAHNVSNDFNLGIQNFSLIAVHTNLGMALGMSNYGGRVDFIGTSRDTPGGVITGSGTVTNGVLHFVRFFQTAPDGTTTDVTSFDRITVV